jgi:pSer/pThr/pTyr-binding forkhead associated (FHA) protein
MPVLLIRADAVRHFMVNLQPGELVIGRADADIVLPHSSVSRRHAKVIFDASGVSVEDLESQNGTQVNKEKITRRVLRSRDQIVVGRYTLIFLGDGKDDRFYNGRFVSYFPAWRGSADEPPEHESTAILTPEALKSLQQTAALLESSRVVDLDDPRQFWYPEARGLTFGRAGMVQVKGWLTFGVFAEIQWDGKRHVLRRKAWWGTVSHKGLAVDNAPLRDGDEIQVGNTRLKYTLSEAG